MILALSSKQKISHGMQLISSVQFLCDQERDIRETNERSVYTKSRYSWKCWWLAMNNDIAELKKLTMQTKKRNLWKMNVKINNFQSMASLYIEYVATCRNMHLFERLWEEGV